jgi:hypothetical protein
VGGERLAGLITALHEYLKRYRDYFPQLRPDIVSLRTQADGSAWSKALAALLQDLEPPGVAR